MPTYNPGDFVTITPDQPSDPAGPAIVLSTYVDEQQVQRATVRTLGANFTNDVPIGPSSAWTRDPVGVALSESGAPNTAALSASSRLPQDLRDGARNVPVQSYRSASWTLVNPARDEFACSTPDRDMWLELTTTTDVTAFSFELAASLGTTTKVEIYRRSGAVTSGPDAAFATVVVPAWSVSSNPAVAGYQPLSIEIGSVYPGPLQPRTYLLRVLSGADIPGLQLHRGRYWQYWAAPITA